MSRKQLPSYNCRVTKGIFLPAVLSLATKLRTFFQIATVTAEGRDKFIARIERYTITTFMHVELSATFQCSTYHR